MWQDQLIQMASKAVSIRSYSDEEGEFAIWLKAVMEELGFDEVTIDSTGNVIGRLGHGPKVIQFDAHMDTVQASDEGWTYPPFSGAVQEGFLWGRGSVDMKSALCASTFAAMLAKREGLLEGKTVYVTGTVCEEFCDGENLRHLYEELAIKPDYSIICEPSNNQITLGHKGKAQIRITTHGLSAHGSAPEKGKNAVYEMAEIITRVEKLNDELMKNTPEHGTVVLSDIRSVSVSLNAVPSSCSIYLDRRLAMDENLEQVRTEMEALIKGKEATWEVGTLHHTTWKQKALHYEPMHEPWKISEDHVLTQAMVRARNKVCSEPGFFEFWDFGTNAITPVAMGIPTIGLGPGNYKLAHMVDERCAVDQLIEAAMIYKELIQEL